MLRQRAHSTSWPVICVESTLSVLSRGRFVSHIRDALKRLGLDSSVYSGHSFRIGAATTAAERGIPDSTIQALGRWKSAAFLRYSDDQMMPIAFRGQGHPPAPTNGVDESKAVTVALLPASSSGITHFS